MSSISKIEFLNYIRSKQELDKKFGKIIVESAKIKEARDDVKKIARDERQAERMADPEYAERRRSRQRQASQRLKDKKLLKPVEPVSQGSDEVFLSDEELARPPAENLPQLKQEIKHIQRKFFNYM